MLAFLGLGDSAVVIAVCLVVVVHRQAQLVIEGVELRRNALDLRLLLRGRNGTRACGEERDGKGRGQHEANSRLALYGDMHN